MRDCKVLIEAYEKVTEAYDPKRRPVDYTVEKYEAIVKELLSITQFDTFLSTIEEYFPLDHDFPPGTSMNWDQALINLGLGSSTKGKPNYTKIAGDLYYAAMEADAWNRGENEDQDQGLLDAEEYFDDLRKSIKAREELYKDNPGINIDI